MSKRVYFFLLSFISTTAIHIKAQNIVPPSPVSHEFAKYITHEVSLYNGIPEISIPLYTIKLKNLSIPINLSYHASGIKYGQDAGDVGLGWVLNPGYRFSRTIYGYPDENYQMPANFDYALYQVGLKERDRLLSQFIPEIQTPASGVRLDGEYDQFTYSYPNGGGQCIISDRINKVLTTAEQSNDILKYKTGTGYCASSGEIIGFQITDECGIKYSFGEYNAQTSCKVEHALFNNNSTAWGLSEILTPVGEEVSFNYTLRQVGGWDASHISYTEIESEYEFNIVENISPGSGYVTFFPGEIITPYEKIVFSHSSASPNMLNSIQVFGKSDNLIKHIDFYYSGVFLDHITINDIETYTFEYYPNPSGQAMDQWGYYQQGQNFGFHSEFGDDPIKVVTNDYDPYNDECFWSTNIRSLSEYFPGFLISRNSISNIPNFNSLKKINYPTGGYSEYIFESNVSSSNNGGGIRVSEIKSYDPISNNSLIRRYEYGMNGNGLGSSIIGVTSDLFVNESFSFIQGASGFCVPSYPFIWAETKQRTYSSEIQGDIRNMLMEHGYTMYSDVTEFYSSSEEGNGKNCYLFDIGNPFSAGPLAVDGISIPNGDLYPNYPYYVNNYRLWDRPRMVAKSIYKQIGSNYTLVKDESFEYHFPVVLSTYNGLKVKILGSTPQSPQYDPNVYDEVLTSQGRSLYDYGEYTYETGRIQLDRKQEVEYLNGETFKTETTYEYSNLLVSKEIVKRSNGDTFVNYISYPSDYAPGTLSIDEMKNQGLINFPIEKVNYVENGSSKKIVSGSISQYKAGAKGLIDSQWDLEVNSPIDFSSFKFSNRTTGSLPPNGSATIFSPDNRYAKRITYDSYDSYGNPQQVHKENDMNVSYYWGYNNYYPVAKLENLTYSEFLNNSTLYNNVNQLQNYSDVSDINIRNNLKVLNNNIRNSLPANVLISTYTYKPLVGMTSETNPNGNTTYYEYDSFGRLKLIRDDDGRIIKTYEYHYKQ